MAGASRKGDGVVSSHRRRTTRTCRTVQGFKYRSRMSLRTSGSALRAPLARPAQKKTTVTTPLPRREPIFDLRTTRDLSSRRVWRGNLRGLVRTIILATGDSLAIILAVRLLVSVAPTALPGDWIAQLPRILLLALLGQSAAGTFGPGRA